MPFDCVCRLTLNQFKEYIAARLGGDPSLIDFFSLGIKLDGHDTELWKHSYVVPGALIQMSTRRIQSTESAPPHDL